MVPKSWFLCFTLFLLAVVGFIDYITGSEDSGTLLYLIPISLAAWFLGRWLGIIAAFSSGLISFLANTLIPPHATIPPMDYWNATARLIIFLACSLTIAFVKQILDSLQQERLRSQQLASQIISAQEEERKRVARELHDESGQALAALTLKIEEVKRRMLEQSEEYSPMALFAADLDHLRTTTEHVLTEQRQLAFNLRPNLLEDLGLEQALTSLFREQLTKRGIQVYFLCELGETLLSFETELILFRIAQEAISNIIKHAKASIIHVNLSSNSGKVILEISDNGIGFELKGVGDSPLRGQSPMDNNGEGKGLGLFGMKERLTLLSGEFNLSTSPGNGTTILASVPVLEKCREHVLKNV